MVKPRRQRKRPVQLELPLAPFRKNGRGGARSGAGRKPGKGRRNVQHRARPAHSKSDPLHVVMRSKFRPLRRQFVFPTLRKALAQATRARAGFRIIQFSVQADHLHLIVEAADKSALSRGMQGLAIRVARAVNRLVFRSGKFWADRFFSRALTSPRAARHALAYVLNNFRKHHATGPARTKNSHRIDPYSSAPYFAGFRELRGSAPCEIPRARELPLTPLGVPPLAPSEQAPIVKAKTWLAKVGWRRAGTIGFKSIGRDERNVSDHAIGSDARAAFCI
jgi:putative transposase